MIHDQNIVIEELVRIFSSTAVSIKQILVNANSKNEFVEALIERLGQEITLNSTHDILKEKANEFVKNTKIVCNEKADKANEAYRSLLHNFNHK